VDAVVLIPARLESTRFPRKVLADQTGRTLIQHVYEGAARSGATRVVVATDSHEVATAVTGFGGEAVLTGCAHENGTSRLAEAAALLGLGDDEVVVNVQGDEPEIDPEVVAASVEALTSDPGISIGTVASPIHDEAESLSASVVKVVVGRVGPGGVGRALYFSRAAIPFERDGSGSCARLKHVGIYAYCVGFLRAYATMEPTPLERAERLEQLRAIENGYGIGVAVREVASVGIDTPADYERFVARWLGPAKES
jgi:3-deoxy-manno-octulosonate cytidylyltransferase (CMP-KDO synthetase)